MSRELIQLALVQKQYTQRQLAEWLGVSATQITKWKQGEYMSDKISKHIIAELKLGKTSPKVVLAIGSLAQAKRWCQTINHLADLVAKKHICFTDKASIHEQLIDILNYFSINYAEFPMITAKSAKKAIGQHVVLRFIYDLFAEYASIFVVYQTHIQPLNWEKDEAFRERLLTLAATNLTVSQFDTDKTFDCMKQDTIEDYQSLINELKLYCLHSNKPLKIELSHLIRQTEDNPTVIHPDIYMNELLTTARLFRLLLPELLKQIDISDELLEKMANYQ